MIGPELHQALGESGRAGHRDPVARRQFLRLCLPIEPARGLLRLLGGLPRIAGRLLPRLAALALVVGLAAQVGQAVGQTLQRRRQRRRLQLRGQPGARLAHAGQVPGTGAQAEAVGGAQALAADHAALR